MCVILLLLKLPLKQLTSKELRSLYNGERSFGQLLYYYSSLWVIYFSGLIHTRTKLFPWKTTKLYRPLKVHCALWLIKRKSTWINQVIDLLKLKDDFWRILIYPFGRQSAGKTIGGTLWTVTTFPCLLQQQQCFACRQRSFTAIYCGT